MEKSFHTHSTEKSRSQSTLKTNAHLTALEHAMGTISRAAWDQCVVQTRSVHLRYSPVIFLTDFKEEDVLNSVAASCQCQIRRFVNITSLSSRVVKRNNG
ncbi:hypothetical protein evm_007787 [Chilo suppressalis]|nr:hypothetical protein evm_007787 [Chilo suppressalis]